MADNPEAPVTGGPAVDSHLEKLLDRRFGTVTRRRRRLIVLILLLGFTFWFVPPVWRLVYGPITVTRWDRKSGETQAVVGPGAKRWTPTKKISRHALHAIIAAEDGKFYEHHGFDFQEISSSFQTNLKKKRFARGGSTISQQVVKMAFLSREKTLIRKAREALGTVLMEAILPKDKILEWYINLAEFGDGVYGVEEGSWHYFKTKPELLSIDQSVHLALVLPSPNAWSRGLRNRRLTPFGHRRFASILNRMRQSGYITKTQWATAITRGDFGRPILGYASLLAAEEEKKPLCPGNPGCLDTDEDDGFDEDQAEMSYPNGTATQVPVPVPIAETTSPQPVESSALAPGDDSAVAPREGSTSGSGTAAAPAPEATSPQSGEPLPTHNLPPIPDP